jgi:hypothetical protein
MKDISYVDLIGNPVASVLDVQHCKLKVTTFPTNEFVCRHMSQTLRVLNFPNQSTVTKIDRCIDSINNLEKILLPYNNLTADGIPSNILNFEFSKLKEMEIDIAGNDIILNEFSWENENIRINEVNKDLNRFDKLVYFLSTYFQSVKVLNLRGNQIRDEHTIYNLLDNMTILERLDVSNNKIKFINERNKFLRHKNQSFILFDLWPSLKLLDISSNPIDSIGCIEFCVFFETRGILLNITDNNINHIQWHKSARIFGDIPNREYFLSTSNMSELAYRFPQSIVQQMEKLQSFVLKAFENVLLTTSDLDCICHLNKMRYLTLEDLHFNVQYIPNTCSKIATFSLKNVRHNYAVLNYTWPKFWSEENTIRQIYVNVGAIDMLQIQKPVNSSQLETLQFLDHINKFPIFGLPTFLFDGSLPNFRNFNCKYCHFVNTGLLFPPVTNTSKLRQLKYEYAQDANGSSVAHVGTLNDSIFKGKDLRILELRKSAMTGDINLSVALLNRLLCLDLEGSLGFNKLETTDLFYVQGELWLPRIVANLNKLLENATGNVTGPNEKNKTFWRINNMVCSNEYKHPNVRCAAIKKSVDFSKKGTNVLTVLEESFCGQDMYMIDLYLQSTK